jgi:hypothetical protein
MAVRTGTSSQPSTNVHVFVWSGLTQASLDTGEPLTNYDYADCSIQVGGTFGTGGAVIFEGSNDGVSYFTLNDVAAAPLSKTAAGLFQLAEVSRYVRPRISAGDGTTSITVTLYGRRPR